jgi:hypothetical protein
MIKKEDYLWFVALVGWLIIAMGDFNHLLEEQDHFLWWLNLIGFLFSVGVVAIVVAYRK